jgi:hypothetical protein
VHYSLRYEREYKKVPWSLCLLNQYKDFLVEAVNQIQDRFGDCQKLDFLSFLSLFFAYNLKNPSMGGLCKKMPLLIEVAGLQEVTRSGEISHLVLILNPKLIGKWHFRKKQQQVCEPAFPNLIKHVKTLLSMPYSNADGEMVFINHQLKLIKTDHRAYL